MVRLCAVGAGVMCHEGSLVTGALPQPPVLTVMKPALQVAPRVPPATPGETAVLSSLPGCVALARSSAPTSTGKWETLPDPFLGQRFPALFSRGTHSDSGVPQGLCSGVRTPLPPTPPTLWAWFLRGGGLTLICQ